MLFAFAWIAGESILIARWIKAGAPPTPGAILLPSGLFLGLAVIAEYQPARTAATAFAWALDLAVLLQVLPGQSKTTITGWPPLMINDATVVMPPGGTTPATAAATSSTGTATGGVQAV